MNWNSFDLILGELTTEALNGRGERMKEITAKHTDDYEGILGKYLFKSMNTRTHAQAHMCMRA